MEYDVIRRGRASAEGKKLDRDRERWERFVSTVPSARV